MAEQLVLKVDGQQYEGWQKVSVSQGLDALAGHFEIELSDRWSGQAEAWTIEAGSPCEIALGDDKLMTAYVDQARYRIDSDQLTITVSGREKTGDLIDCSAVHSPGSWTNRKLEQIAGDLAKPFGIKVKAIASTGAAFPKFALQQGETVSAALDRMTRQRGLLVVTTAEGDVEIRSPGKEAAGYSLKLGETLLWAEFNNDVSERFSDYLVKGYARTKVRAGGGQPKATAKDGGTPRYRPMVLVHDEQATIATVTARSKWEASVRAARAREVRAGVVGWRGPNGALFRADRLVPITALPIGVDDELLIAEVQFLLDEQGHRVELTLTPKEAFSPEPPPAPKGKTKGRGAKPLTKS